MPSPACGALEPPDGAGAFGDGVGVVGETGFGPPGVTFAGGVVGRFVPGGVAPPAGVFGVVPPLGTFGVAPPAGVLGVVPAAGGVFGAVPAPGEVEGGVEGGSAGASPLPPLVAGAFGFTGGRSPVRLSGSVTPAPFALGVAGRGSIGGVTPDGVPAPDGVVAGAVGGVVGVVGRFGAAFFGGSFAAGAWGVGLGEAFDACGPNP